MTTSSFKLRFVDQLPLFSIALGFVAIPADFAWAQTPQTMKIPPEALPAPYPKPNPAQAFAAFKIYEKPGRPLRIPHGDWEGAKKRAQNDLKWADWLAKQRAATDDWIARRQDRVEWIAGWWHDFVSPQDGSTLTWTPDEPGENTLFSPSTPSVKLTPKLHGAWVYMFRFRNGDQMLQAARLYRLTGEKKYADWVIKQLDFYADNFHLWPDQFRGSGIWKSRAHLMHQPLDEAVNLIKHINAALLVEGEISAKHKQGWIDKLFRPQAELLDESFQSIHNIACWQRSAMGHVALYAGDEALWKRAIDARFGLRSQLREGVTSDYLWYEQSLSYNNYVLSATQPLFEFAARVGRLDDLREEAEIIENLMLAPLSLRFPDGRLPTPADAPMKRIEPNVLAGAARLFPTQIGVQEAARQLNWNTLLDPIATPIPAGKPVPASAQALPQELPPVQSMNLESSRMAVLKQGDWQIFFHYGQITASHAQKEALNFEVSYRGNDLSHDSGTVGYGSPLHSNYFTQGLAHNVPLINGVGQPSWNRGELTVFDAVNSRVEATQPYADGALVRRALQIENGVLRDVVSLQAGPNAPVTTQLGLALHLQGKVQLSPEFVPDTSFSQDRPPAFLFWQGVKSATFQDKAVFDVTFPQGKMRLTFEMPGQFRLSHASTPDAPARHRDSFYLETTGPKTQIVTTLSPLTP